MTVPTGVPDEDFFEEDEPVEDLLKAWDEGGVVHFTEKPSEGTKITAPTEADEAVIRRAMDLLDTANQSGVLTDCRELAYWLVSLELPDNDARRIVSLSQIVARARAALGLEAEEN